MINIRVEKWSVIIQDAMFCYGDETQIIFHYKNIIQIRI